jgi:hypothetical protein
MSSHFGRSDENRVPVDIVMEHRVKLPVAAAFVSEHVVEVEHDGYQ